jgi:hypothetical protein
MNNSEATVQTQIVGDIFYILDFDRCVGNTNALFDQFERTVMEHTGMTAWSLRNVRDEVEAVGDSFDTATYVRAQLKLGNLEGEWHQLEESFVTSCEKVNTLNPGARELMTWLEQRQLPYGTVTYGEQTWQRLKLRASGLEKMPCFITDNKHKSVLFKTWQGSDGRFTLPEELGGGTYSSIVLVDDKAVSFDGFPSLPSHGYWVLNPHIELPSQEGTVPENVKRFSSLEELLVELNKN